MEKRIFIYGDNSYEYFLINQNRKTISLAVQPNLQILLKCPINYSQGEIDKFLKRKWLWLKKQITYFKKYKKRKIVKEYVSGESFLYLGRQYKLIIKHASENKVDFSYGKLSLFTTKNINNKKHNKKILENWYLERMNKIFSEEYEKAFQNFNYSFKPKLITREMSKRWGSFLNNEKIILNPKLIQAPKECINYVLNHELCHMEHKNHNAIFYQTLKSKIPNWEKLKEKLEMRFS